MYNGVMTRAETKRKVVASMTNYLNIDKDTRKLWRLQSEERCEVNRINQTDFEIYSNDHNFKAFVGVQGTIISSKVENYNKVDFYKFRNYCSLMALCHFGIKSTFKEV